jgi:hypothetical protein
VADPDEKEQIKKELSQRYYQHYLSIINTPEGQPENFAILEESTTVGCSEEDKLEPGGGSEELSTENQELAELAEVAPIKLTQPSAPEPAPGMAAQPSDKPARKKWCFIATAAYGSPLAREVVLLQNYRDNYLSRNFLGEKFIRAYYFFSPTLAELIRHQKGLQLLTRILLAPLILLIKKLPGNRPGHKICPK